MHNRKSAQDPYLAACLRDIGATCSLCQQKRSVIGYVNDGHPSGIPAPVYDHSPAQHILAVGGIAI